MKDETKIISLKNPSPSNENIVNTPQKSNIGQGKDPITLKDDKIKGNSAKQPKNRRRKKRMMTVVKLERLESLLKEETDKIKKEIGASRAEDTYQIAPSEYYDPRNGNNESNEDFFDQVSYQIEALT